MIAIALQSGSNGNCIYVESGPTRLLFDAGISGVRAQRRLAAEGRDIRTIDALIISHDHSDHVRSAGIYQRKFGVPLHITRDTLAAAARRYKLGTINDVHHFASGDVLRFGDVSVETIPTPHDGVDGSAFIVEADGRRLGILTDLGHVFEDLPEIMASLDGVLIESNYDPAMLKKGSYPPFVKDRIRGAGGHLSNGEAAALLQDCTQGRLQWACLSHLSGENNSPAVAMQTHQKAAPAHLTLLAASRDEAVILPEL